MYDDIIDDNIITNIKKNNNYMFMRKVHKKCKLKDFYEVYL